MPASLVCRLCTKIFSKTFNLKRHYKNVHSTPYFVPSEELQTSLSSIKCPICTSTFCKFSEFNEHLITFHEIKLQTEELTFSNEDEFMLWKTSMEDKENSLFVKTRGSKYTKGKQIVTYQCNRSGFYKSKVGSPPERKRHLKIQGSSKINACCPARIQLAIEKDKVSAKFFKTHVGHSVEIKHLPIPPEDKYELASKIAKKIPFDVIIDDVESSVSDVLKRKHFLTKQDLRNIVREYSVEINCIQRDTVN